MRLQGKVAIITGGGGAGIGHAIAARFGREGCAVVVSDVNEAGASAVAAEIVAAGGRAASLRVDASRGDDVRALVDLAIDTYGRLTTVVNCAAMSVVKYLHEISEEEWRRTIDGCLTSVYLTARHALPHLIKAGRAAGPSIVSISSANGVVTNPNFGGYSAGKSGVLGLTRSLALDYGPYGIRANAICPGLVLNDVTRPRNQADAAEWAGNVDCYPLGEIGTPEDIANAALYLASDEARWVTGATLMVDGGLTIQSPEAVIRPSFRRRWKPGTTVAISPSAARQTM